MMKLTKRMIEAYMANETKNIDKSHRVEVRKYIFGDRVEKEVKFIYWNTAVVTINKTIYAELFKPTHEVLTIDNGGYYTQSTTRLINDIVNWFGDSVDEVIDNRV